MKLSDTMTEQHIVKINYNAVISKEVIIHADLEEDAVYAALNGDYEEVLDQDGEIEGIRSIELTNGDVYEVEEDAIKGRSRR